MTQAIWGDPRFAVAHWGNRRGRAWKGSELVKASQMKFEGVPNWKIAAELNRTVGSVERKVGYEKKRKFVRAA